MNLDSFTFLPSFTSGATDKYWSMLSSFLFWSNEAGRSQLQLDDLASLLKRLVGSFQHLYHVQSCSPVVKGLLIVQNAIHEVCGFQLQRFHLFHARRPHIARAVADEQLIDSVAAHLHTLVIN